MTQIKEQPLEVRSDLPDESHSTWRRRLIPGNDGALMIASNVLLLSALIVFVLNGQGIAPLRYYGTILGLSTMLVLHVFWLDLQTRLGVQRADLLHLVVNSLLFWLVNYLGLGVPGAFSGLPFILFMLSAEGLVTFGWRRGLVYAAVLTSGWFTILLLRDNSWSGALENLASISLGMVFTLVTSWVVLLFQGQTARAQALADELRAANAALAAAAERERELAAAEERVRLAHDIHDGLGHHLTVLNVQLQAAVRLVDRDPQRAQDTIALCRREAQAALDEVRRSVAALRRSPLDNRSLHEAISALVSDFDRASPLQASFTQHGESFDLSPAAAMSLFRAAQEGLTNAQKHAVASMVQVVLTFHSSGVTLRVQNDGSTTDAPDGSGGFGLAGLRERAERLGGTVDAGPLPQGGFRLEMRLPHV
ncbi:MAG: sensor histidine kinase [Oscillochloris sp.]|nr:sensor histidine kinase [Oscillochloris sp.]